MITLLKKIAAQETLTEAEAERAMHLMMTGEAEAEQIAAFLLGLRSRGESIDELVGLTRVMRQFAVPVALDDPNAIDLCGTGGDGSGTFNVSTTAAFVCAGAGVTVAKHGNRSVSSECGSSDVLESLGVNTMLPSAGVEHCLREAGIAFIFAPLFHPALKHVMPVRRKLGVRTFFNILGPMCNPAGVKRQMVGAFSKEVARSMGEILMRLEADHVLAVHSEDGMDELSISGPSVVYSYDVTNGDSKLRESQVEPSLLGYKPAPATRIRGGSPKVNAQIVTNVLEGRAGPHRDVVTLNAAFALSISGRFASIGDCIVAANQSIDSGEASRSLQRLIESSNLPPS
jgi:anthranilate phosphoribosyltransferase